MKRIIEALRSQGLTICTAESCTSGLVCAALTSVSGASDVVVGGAVVYQTQMKNHILGLRGVTEDNVVSREVANYMAIQVAEKFGTSVAVATTGYLEPYNERAPEAYVAILYPGSPPYCERVALSATQARLENREKVVDHALGMVAAKLCVQLEVS